MRIAAAVLGLAFAAMSAPVVAQTPPEGIVWMVLNDINGVYFDRNDPTNRPPLATTPPEGMIRPVVVSNDGRADWLVDYGEAGQSRFCGTGGCLQRLYVSDGGDYVRAFDAQAFTLAIGGRPDVVRIDVWVHHLYCADDSRDCRYSYEWDEEARRLVERGTSSPRPMGEGAFDPIRPDGD